MNKHLLKFVTERTKILLLFVSVFVFVTLFRLLPWLKTTDDSIYISAIVSALMATFIGCLALAVLQKWLKPTIRARLSVTEGLAVIMLTAVLTLTVLYLLLDIFEHKGVLMLVSFSTALYVSWVPLALKSSSTKMARLLVFMGLVAITALLFYGALDFSWYRLNPDGISYYSIAEHYANGYVHEAINAYWSPLLSWLIVPFLWVGLVANTAYRILLVVFSLSIVTGQFFLLRNIIPRKSLHYNEVVYAGTVLMMFFCLSVVQTGLITPDLLVVAWVMLVLVFAAKALKKKWFFDRYWVIWSLLLGLLGATGFYIKGFLLPFFIVLVVSMMLAAILAKYHRRRIWQAGAVMLATSALLIAPWVVLLHGKYGVWTTGSANKYNISWVGPQSIKHPISHQLLAPPNQYATTAWEDPTTHPYVKWSPTQSIEDLQFHVFTNVPQNAKAIIEIMTKWSVLAFVMLAGGFVVVGMSKKSSQAWHDPRIKIAILAGVMGIIYLGGYVAVHIVGGERYIWPVLLLLIVNAGILYSYIINRLELPKQRASFAIIAILLMAQFGALYINDNLRTYALEVKKADYIITLAKDLNGLLPQGSNIAGTGRNYDLAYWLRVRTFGSTFREDVLSHDQLIAELNKYDIDYYICTNAHTTCGFPNDMLVWKSEDNRKKVFKVGDDD